MLLVNVLMWTRWNWSEQNIVKVLCLFASCEVCSWTLKHLNPLPSESTPQGDEWGRTKLGATVEMCFCNRTWEKLGLLWHTTVWDFEVNCLLSFAWSREGAVELSLCVLSAETSMNASCWASAGHHSSYVNHLFFSSMWRVRVREPLPSDSLFESHNDGGHQ